MDLLILLGVTLAKIVFFTFLLVLTLVAYSVYAERRFSAILQDRVGPNRTGIPLTILGFEKDLQLPIGALTQPLADGLKFILKEDFVPGHVRKAFFWLAPALTMVPALVTVAVIPFGSDLHFGDFVIPMSIADLDVGPLFIFAIASLSVYGITLAGWASNNKYSFLGGVRSSAQMISYEISLGLSVVPILLVHGQLNLGDIVQSQADGGWAILPLWNEGGIFLSEGYRSIPDWWMPLALFVPLFISFIIFTISIFAETNRTPFDLAECETELVGGYHTEYSSMKFALFFLGEYAAMIVGSSLIVTLFLGGWSIGFGLDQYLTGTWLGGFVHLGVFLTKVVGFVLFFILVRWSIPRFRYDQLMHLGWIIFFEAALINVFVTALILATASTSVAPAWGIGLGFIVLTVISAGLMWVVKSNDEKTVAPKTSPEAIRA